LFAGAPPCSALDHVALAALAGKPMQAYCLQSTLEFAMFVET
jgi:hypothetical protein